jgi:chromosome segregation protein
MAETEEKILTRERDEALGAIAQAQQALAQEEVLLTTLEEEEKSLQEALQSQDTALAELRQKIQIHQAQVSQLRLEAETMRERLLGKEREEESARRQYASLEQRIAQADREQAGTAERLTQLAATQEEKSKSLELLRLVREDQQTRLTTLLNERQGVQEKLHQEDQALSGLRQTVSQAQAQAQEAEFQTRTLEAEKIRFEQALLTSYQLSVDEARVQFGEITPPNAEELARVRRRLENLGSVNMAAPEEHAQLEERYQFLLTQQQDLLKAKDDLHQAITKINQTTREHFKTTFEQVRQNFRMLYQTLFQGGEADVILTDEQNLLESGIDIVACPPGKKLQSIGLLSGGEKALTAIALLFAFFMVKPSPFCLLDEVDAPLDEANVGRFLRMVKSFSEKTQFIVITHNKRTMEMADVLYGVTMAELGVSSLISVKMESRTPAGVAA